MLRLALKNILRNIRRTILTGLSITLAVTIVVYLWSFITGVVENSFENFVRTSSGHIRILNKDYFRKEKMLPLSASIKDYEKIEEIATSFSDVLLSQPRIKFGVLLENNGKSKSVMGIGVDPEKEERISALGKHLIEGRKINLKQKEINIGDRLAEELKLKLGDTLTIVTQTAYGSLSAMNLKIVGIFRMGVPSIDGRVFYLPLDTAQSLLDLEGRVTEIFLILKNGDKAPCLAKEIEKKINEITSLNFAVIPWQEQGIIYFWMKLAKFIYGFIYFMILFLASFTILNTMFMAVLERKAEIGMLKALGFKNGQIVRLILLESGLLGFFASLIGAMLGAVISYYLSTKGLDFTGVFNKLSGSYNFPVSYVYRAKFSFGIVFTGFFLGIFFSVLASVPPALRAVKMEPVEALREG